MVVGGYDVARYTEIVLRANETILTPLGMNGKMLSSWLAQELPAQHLHTRLERGDTQYWGCCLSMPCHTRGKRRS